MSEPLITILMPVRNGAAYIGQAIASVLEQTFSEFELLIINDGSTDHTVAEIRRFDDNRIRLISQPASGIAAALNLGLQQARGNWIARFDADDICMPQRLEKQIRFLRDHPGMVLCGSDAEYITESGEFLFHFSCAAHTHDEITAYMQTYCPFIHSTVMYHKMTVIKAGGYSAYAHQFEDYLLWVKLADTGYLGNIAEPLCRIRFNPLSVTIDEKWRSRRFRAIKRRVIRKAAITQEEGDMLQQEIRKQENSRLKQGAYEALCGKKYLLDNHQPAAARRHLKAAMKLFPFRADNYALYMLSYFPKPVIQWLHAKSPNKI